MSWAESEKLNEWILRAYENGRREEQERIIKLLEQMEKHIYYTNFVAPQGTITRVSESPVSITLADAIALIKGETND